MALDELKYMVSDIKNSPNEKKFLLNKNILDKFSRIIERKYFNVNILIAKIYENILDPDNFNILSNDSALLINFSNEVLNLLESIKFTIVSRQLDKRCSAFLSYLSSFTGLDDEQKEIISELIKNFPTRNSSQVYKTFDEIKDKIINNCKNTNLEEKLDGLNTLMEAFGNTVSLEEQFDLLIEKVPVIIKTLIHQPNVEYKDAYFQLGNFICSMLFATKFKLDAYLPEYRIHRDELNKNYFFVIADDQLIDETEKEDITFLHNTVFELTTQREVLLKCENIYQICSLITSALSIYENVFDLQYVCYIILKRIYFTFPQFRKHMEDILAMTLINLCCFKEAFEKESTEEVRHFIQYLLKEDDEDLKAKLNKRIEAKNANIDVKFEEDTKDIEFENLRLADFNLRVGYPSSVDIDAGSEMSRYIEVHNANSLVYVGFATSANDISLHLMKYVAADEMREQDSTNNTDDEEEFSDNGHFVPILKVERIDSSISPVKIVMFVREPGTYKIIFDNHFSWFTGKTLRYRLSVLKPLSEIDVERKVDFAEIKSQMNRQKKEEREQGHHGNKILMVKFEGKNRVYKVDNIFSKQNAIKNRDRFEIIPVLLANNKIRIIAQEEILEYTNEDSEVTFEKFFESCLDEYFKRIDNFEIKTVFLNLFLLEKIISENTVLPVTEEEFYKNTVTKLGFFPTLSKNVKFSVHNIADSCLLFSLYQKILNKDEIKNTIHIHFDKYKAQPALYFDGVINDKISGFNYDYDMSLMENVDNVLNFANKVAMVFGGFELSISCSDVDQKIFEMFADALKVKIGEISLESPIVVELKHSEFIKNVTTLIELFEFE